MNTGQKMYEAIGKAQFDCSKCPIPKDECLEMVNILKEGKGSYTARDDCLLKIILTATSRFFFSC